MNSKRSVYLLLPLVVLVWGLIGWRVWVAAGEASVEAGLQEFSIAPQLAQGPVHPPSLLLNYPDPFRPLSGVRSVEKMASPAPVADLPPPRPLPAFPPRIELGPSGRATASPPVTATAVSWPQVKYLGIITHANGPVQVALLSIDSEEAVVKVGQGAHGIQVLRLFRDSVQLRFGTQQRSFRRYTE